jgi:hypothetical protein
MMFGIYLKSCRYSSAPLQLVGRFLAFPPSAGCVVSSFTNLSVANLLELDEAEARRQERC